MERHRFTVHSNGDHPDRLKQQFIDVMNAARALDEALKKAAPNSRNYYLKLTGEADFRDDRNEYEAVRRKTEEIRAWAEEGAILVLEQAG